MECRKIQEYLSAYLDGELPEAPGGSGHPAFGGLPPLSAGISGLAIALGFSAGRTGAGPNRSDCSGLGPPAGTVRSPGGAIWLWPPLCWSAFFWAASLDLICTRLFSRVRRKIPSSPGKVLRRRLPTPWTPCWPAMIWRTGAAHEKKLAGLSRDLFPGPQFGHHWSFSVFPPPAPSRTPADV